MNAVYDRQIRLWGAEAQKRIGETRALVLGLGGVNVELTKNLVLAGISVTLWDPKELESTDLAWNFFADIDGLGKNRAVACVERVRRLNEFADIRVAEGAFSLEGHQVVLFEDLGLGFDVGELNDTTRAAGAYFYYVKANTEKAVAVIDLGRFEYRVKIGEGENAKLSEWRSTEYPSFREASPPDVASHGQLGYINAIVAGILGQEVIKAISKKGEPINNMFVYENLKATVYSSQPKKKPKIDPSQIIELD